MCVLYRQIGMLGIKWFVNVFSLLRINERTQMYTAKLL